MSRNRAISRYVAKPGHIAYLIAKYHNDMTEQNITGTDITGHDMTGLDMTG